jgi:hypothetical protein
MLCKSIEDEAGRFKNVAKVLRQIRKRIVPLFVGLERGTSQWRISFLFNSQLSKQGEKV